jgi:hypothetical protein
MMPSARRLTTAQYPVGVGVSLAALLQLVHAQLTATSFPLPRALRTPLVELIASASFSRRVPPNLPESELVPEARRGASVWINAGSMLYRYSGSQHLGPTVRSQHATERDDLDAGDR